MFDIKSIERYPKYPIHINESEGEHMAVIFTEKPLGKNTVRKFSYDYNGYRYYLLEELMIEENTEYEDVKREKLHIIGKNFFLNREKL